MGKAPAEALTPPGALQMGAHKGRKGSKGILGVPGDAWPAPWVEQRGS